MKSFSINLLIYSLITVVVLGCVESGLRVLKLFTPSGTPSPTRPDLFVTDNDVGYHLWPSTSTFDRYPSTAQHITDIVSNSDGFRNPREFGAPGNEKRLLIIGDSFVFGLGVNSKDRLTEVLETKISGWRVDNLGMGGWGMDLMLRALEKFGSKINPDIVILAVYTDDFRRVMPRYAGMGFTIPKYELNNGKLASKAYPGGSAWRKLHLTQAAYEIYWYKITNRNRYDLNKALLNRIYQETQNLSAKLVLLYLPGKRDTKEDRERRQFLNHWSITQNVPFLDLHEQLNKAGIDNTYIKGDYHWNANGHRIAASEIVNFLSRETVDGSLLSDQSMGTSGL